MTFHSLHSANPLAPEQGRFFALLRGEAVSGELLEFREKSKSQLASEIWSMRWILPQQASFPCSFPTSIRTMKL
ncbi:hypothetical protein, partial [Bradyrhizobium sp.]|uniref:hypothetical protein n=1 Tax=Bradyrhizobium sp. TaxID=376 RepID=UPI0025C52264